MSAWVSGSWQHTFAWLVVFFVTLSPLDHKPLDTAVFATFAPIAIGAFACLIARTGSQPFRIAQLTVYSVFCVSIVTIAVTYKSHILAFGNISPDALAAVAQTDAREAVFYIYHNSSWRQALAGALAVMFLAVTFPIRSPHRETTQKIPTYAGILALIFTAGAAQSAHRLPVIQYLKHYQTEFAKFKEVMDKRRAGAVPEARSDFSGTVIVIIGESTTRRHMGIYGYHRDTTPLLAQRKQQLLRFTDVISPHSHTVPVLTNALTTAGSDEGQDFNDENAHDIISVANRAGFETYWLSNQNQYGVWDNPITTMAMSSNSTRFFSLSLGRQFWKTDYDGVMLPALEEILSNHRSPRKLVILHLFATHLNYCTHFPDRFDVLDALPDKAFFGNENKSGDAACYDNAVRYVDWIINSVIDMTAVQKEPAVMLYFSDHGEAPLLGTGHNSALHSHFHIEVPFLLWPNRAYQKAHGETLAVGASHQNHPYTLQYLFHSLAGLMKIDSKLVDDELNLFSDRLVRKDRRSINGTITYDRWGEANDHWENARVNVIASGAARPKVWAHRVNSIGTLLEAKDIFAGVEMDLVFNATDGEFHVHHPPAKSTGLTLETMLEAMKDKPRMRLWLDWKNPSQKDLALALRRLADLDRRYRLHDRTLVETSSSATFEQIRSVSEAGFTHGYYLPTSAIVNCLRDCSRSELEAKAAELNTILAAGKFDAVTYDWRLREFVAKYLNGTIKRLDLRQFAWDLSINISDDRNAASLVNERLESDEIDGLLVTFPNKFRY